MRTMRLSLAGVTLAVVSASGVYTPDSASAAKPFFTKDCRGTHQALQAGQCVNLTYENPDRVLQPQPGLWRRNKKKSSQASEK